MIRSSEHQARRPETPVAGIPAADRGGVVGALGSLATRLLGKGGEGSRVAASEAGGLGGEPRPHDELTTGCCA